MSYLQIKFVFLLALKLPQDRACSILFFFIKTVYCFSANYNMLNAENKTLESSQKILLFYFF